MHRDGFVTVRRCREGAKVGPLVADDATAALDMIRHAAAIFGDRIMIDVPVRSERLTQVCQDLNLMPSFQTDRMVKGAAMPAAADLYAVATLELG